MTSSKRGFTVGIATFVLTTLAWLLLQNLSLGDKQIDERIEVGYAASDPQFERVMGAVLGPTLVGGNHVQALQNGDEIFPAMLGAIRSAQRTITFETYIYWSGTIGKEFAQALAERARAGVSVHVMLDWWGSGLEATNLDAMRAAGIALQRYNPPRLTTLGRMNNRTHRKLLVVDGRTGFIGGVGIADAWRGQAQGPQHWRDMHYRVEGPVVAQLQAAFLDNWVALTGHLLHGQKYLPPLDVVGTQAAQAFTSASGGGAESMQLMMLMSIAAARSTLALSMAYFVPDNVAVNSLVAAARRGVRVQMIVPGAYADSELVRRASRFEWGPLLRAGIEIYKYQPTMYHCKVRRGAARDFRCRPAPVAPRDAGRMGGPELDRQIARRTCRNVEFAAVRRATWSGALVSTRLQTPMHLTHRAGWNPRFKSAL
ncbi:MAG: phospholipase D-like domain-containing protein [Polaromonas sp.]